MRRMLRVALGLLVSGSELGSSVAGVLVFFPLVSVCGSLLSNAGQMSSF